MKVKHAIILLVLGFCLDFSGGVMKILHWQGADLVLIAALISKVVGTLILLSKILTYEKLKDFLNW
jgi:uncharacterized membrane protein YdcZ (DUF606 family)